MREFNYVANREKINELTDVVIALRHYVEKTEQLFKDHPDGDSHINRVRTTLLKYETELHKHRSLEKTHIV
ncbi:hypothetical protein JNUCC32_31215 (plasmid) [Paenibacillus sp. JNUCC32]|uniref:hypothetical protein n=1 Tax=Paenibacillus sp. JNUCC32 TaxID=2777984 RepID=UPI0017879A9C|nr:hypothetical protein [Paenibacillus sp. JNUCC-32]QOT13758.1 hypothetical protein JNUCC32_31215 [Paenibacillus sp. JNUCC-32]